METISVSGSTLVTGGMAAVAANIVAVSAIWE